MGAVSRPAPALAIWLALSVLVIALDQYTKGLVVAAFAHGDSVEITSYFNLVRAHNAGAAFSFLADASGWQRWFFVGLGTVASGFMLWLMRSHRDQRLFCFALSMIMGGAVGNVADRLIHGHVIDFLQFHHAGWAFPSFNVADSAITLGAILLIVDELRRMRTRPTAP